MTSALGERRRIRRLIQRAGVAMLVTIDDRGAHAVVERVDYWEPSRSRVARVANAVRAVVTRRAVETPVKLLDAL